MYQRLKVWSNKKCTLNVFYFYDYIGHMKNEPWHPHGKAIEKVGSTLAVAALLGVIPQYVSKWKRRGIPDKRIKDFVKAAKRVGTTFTVEELLDAKKEIRQ